MSGFYILKSDRGHQALPVRGSYRSEATGQPVSLMDPSGYPVTAECQHCHGRIKLRAFRQMEWDHDASAPAQGAS